MLLGSERHVSGTRAFWRKLDRVLDGKPLHSSLAWFRVQELYGIPHVTLPVADIPLPQELQAQAVRLDGSNGLGGMLLLPLETLVPIIEALPEIAPAEEDEDEEETLVRPLGRPRIHRLSPD